MFCSFEISPESIDKIIFSTSAQHAVLVNKSEVRAYFYLSRPPEFYNGKVRDKQFKGRSLLALDDIFLGSWTSSPIVHFSLDYGQYLRLLDQIEEFDSIDLAKRIVKFNLCSLVELNPRSQTETYAKMH